MWTLQQAETSQYTINEGSTCTTCTEYIPHIQSEYKVIRDCLA